MIENVTLNWVAVFVQNIYFCGKMKSFKFLKLVLLFAFLMHKVFLREYLSIHSPFLLVVTSDRNELQ